MSLHRIGADRFISPPDEAAAAILHAEAAIAHEGRSTRWSASARWWLAWALALRRERASSRIELAEAERLSRTDRECAVLRRTGAILSRSGDHAAAVRHLRSAVVHSWSAGAQTDDVEALRGLGAALARAGDHDEAADTLMRTISLASPGTLVPIRRSALLIPPGPHRDQLDDLLRG